MIVEEDPPHRIRFFMCVLHSPHMRALEAGFHDKKGYLDRMQKSEQEKLHVVDYIPEDADAILDVGCANGPITKAIAHLRPHAHVMGIDLSDDFIAAANAKREEVENPPVFEKVWLRQLLDRPERYDAVTFVSVLHEFYTYGNKKPSVIKAIADSYELLNPGGKIIIRDMILPQRMKTATFTAEHIMKKIRANPAMESLTRDFEEAHGPLTDLYAVNHFLLKYMYTENWERECPENYVGVTLEEYEDIARELNMTMIDKRTYLIPYLREKWKADFGLTDEEVSNFFSTTILALQKGEEEDGKR
jgi:2-polyprenyl-3-methyl-5-hydroxy-6-metoxy-1,4-benzoquinol methylase